MKKRVSYYTDKTYKFKIILSKVMNFTHEYEHTNTKINCEQIIQRKSGKVWLYFILYSYVTFGKSLI